MRAHQDYSSQLPWIKSTGDKLLQPLMSSPHKKWASARLPVYQSSVGPLLAVPAHLLTRWEGWQKQREKNWQERGHEAYQDDPNLGSWAQPRSSHIAIAQSGLHCSPQTSSSVPPALPLLMYQRLSCLAPPHSPKDMLTHCLPTGMPGFEWWHNHKVPLTIMGLKSRMTI